MPRLHHTLLALTIIATACGAESAPRSVDSACSALDSAEVYTLRFVEGDRSDQSDVQALEAVNAFAAAVPEPLDRPAALYRDAVTDALDAGEDAEHPRNTVDGFTDAEQQLEDWANQTCRPRSGSTYF